MLKPSGIVSALGANWMHNFDASLRLLKNGATVFVYPGIAALFYSRNGVWELSGPTTARFQLIAVGGNYDFVDPATGLVYTFSASGKLTAVRDRNGNTLTVTQGTAGPLTVSDGLGRTLTFAYSSGRLASVTDQTGRSASFAHSGDDLTAATDANAKTTTYAYASGSLLASSRK